MGGGGGSGSPHGGKGSGSPLPKNQRLRPSPLLGLLQDFSKCGLGIMVFIAPLRGSVFIKGQGGLLIGKRGGRGEPVIMEFLDAPLILWNS